MAEEVAELAQYIAVPSVGAQISPADCMRLAVSEARKGIGFVSPNPAVGCVIVDRKHNFVSSGYHHRYGFSHAEIDALNNVNDQTLLEGATLYVTLEPCAHEGGNKKTGSCAKALAKLSLKRVVYGLVDPYEKVRGEGAKILHAAGIEALTVREAIPFEAEQLELLCEEVAETFLHSQRTGLPFVALKVATTLDGRMAHSSGESKWITELRARQYSHYLRAHYDAVMIGRNTFVTDDPSLNVRLDGFDEQRNFVILVDPSGKTLHDIPQSQILKVRPAEKLIVVLSERALSPDDFAQKQLLVSMGVQFIETPFDRAVAEDDLAATARQLMNPPLDAEYMLKQLRQKNVHSIFVEGGAQTFANLLNAKVVQRLHLFIAPSLLGGRDGLSWTEDVSTSAFANRAQLKNGRWREFGPDLYFTGKF